MKTILAAALLSLLMTVSVSAAAGPDPVVVFETTKGQFMLVLDQAKAPATVENFLKYVKSGFYDGTIFHRIVVGRSMNIVQGGGLTADMREKPGMASIRNEAANGLPNKAGTISMARTSDPDSATSQFFLNVKDNDFLNRSGATPEKAGYCVFGRVLRGMNVVEEISRVATTTKGRYENVPIEPVLVKRAYVYEGQ